MEYKVLEESPVARRFEITVSPDEIAAALGAAIALNRDSVTLPGYRKGKAPDRLIEKRFHDSVYDEAKRNLINVHLNELEQKTGLAPLDGYFLKGDEAPLERGKPFVYTVSFEILPQFEMPNYEGLEVEQTKTERNDQELEQVFDRLRNEHSEFVDVEGNGPAQDGQLAIVDFEAFENGQPVKDFKGANFWHEVGANRALPEFDEIVKGTPKGHTGEGKLHFPDDFIAPDLAGKDVTMKVTVHAIKERKVPELDEEFAKKVGFKNLDTLKDLVTRSYLHNMEKMQKSEAQFKLLQQLLKQTDYPLPPSLVISQSQVLLGEEARRLEQMGKTLAAIGKTPEELLAKVKPQAEDLARSRVLLMTIARKENLEVSREELYREVMENSIRKNENFEENLRKLEETRLIFQLRDQMLCDKAMDLIYAKANVKMVEPEQGGSQAEEAAGKDGAAADAGEGAKAASADDGKAAEQKDSEAGGQAG